MEEVKNNYIGLVNNIGNLAKTKITKQPLYMPMPFQNMILDISYLFQLNDKVLKKHYIKGKRCISLKRLHQCLVLKYKFNQMVLQRYIVESSLLDLVEKKKKVYCFMV